MALAKKLDTFQDLMTGYDSVPEHHKVLYYIYENHLTVKSRRNKKREYEKENLYGYCALAADKSGLKKKPVYGRSYPVLHWKIDKENYTYFKPNLFYTNESFSKNNIRWMLILPFDFDAENLDALKIYTAADLVKYVESFGFEVCAVVRTDTGYHVYLPLRPLFWVSEGKRMITRYDKLLKAMTRLLKADIRSGEAAHYFRLPTAHNLEYFNPTIKPELAWYEEQMAKHVATEEFVPDPVVSDRAPAQVNNNYGRVMSQPAMQRLLSGHFRAGEAAVKGKSVLVARNNACFTLALGFKQDGYTLEEALQHLSAWYLRVDRTDFKWSEVERSARSAFFGEYKCVSPLIVYELTGMWLRPMTPAKPRGERQHHFTEIEADVVEYLREHYKNNQVHLEMAQPQLAAFLDVPVDSLKKVIASMKEKGDLAVEKVRRGRSFVSVFVLSESLLANTEDPSEEQPVYLADEVDTLLSSEFHSATSSNISFANVPPILTDSDADACLMQLGDRLLSSGHRGLVELLLSSLANVLVVDGCLVLVLSTDFYCHLFRKRLGSKLVRLAQELGVRSIVFRS